MSECRKIIRRIQDAENGFDRNILEHCRNCPGCRRELAAKLAAENPGGIEPAARLDRATLAACRNGRLRKFRHRLVRGLGWGAAAAAAAAWLSTAVDVELLRRPFGVYLLLAAVSTVRRKE